jgi:hypothetical protein
MIRLRCSSCGQEVQVASLITAASQVCVACGRIVIGGGAPPERTAEAPAEQWRYDDEPAPTPAKLAEQSIWITLLGLYLIVTGSPGLLLVLCCGGLVAPSLLAPGDFKEEIPRKNKGKVVATAADDDLEEADVGAKAAVAVALVFFGSLFGLQCLAGVGVLRRRQWGRFLTLGSSGLLCLGAFVVALFGGSIVFIVVLFLAFAVTAVVLLSERATAEFTHPKAWFP